jgi:predicted nicotinamide N-methyase
MGRGLRAGRTEAIRLTAVIIDRAAFIRANTSLIAPPLIPEIRLHLAHEAVPLWVKTEEEMGELGLPPPFWAFAWAGGQALARYILDTPEIVRGRRIIDLATGSAIAAMKAGAASALAADIDLFAVEAAYLNATANGVLISVTAANLLDAPAPDCDVILVGDLFYEKTVAAAALAWLRDSGRPALIGDPGRSYLPKEALEKIAEYAVPVTRDLEDAEIKRTAVWRLR